MYSASSIGDCRRHARAILSAAFLNSLKNVEKIDEFDKSVESVRQKIIQRPKLLTKQPDEKIVEPPSIILSKELGKAQKAVKRAWSPVIDGKRAIISIIDQVWNIPYAPCQYSAQFMCTVHLCQLLRHKYCVRWQNGRRSAIFYVNIDETENSRDIWINFPGEIKSHRPHSSHAHFQRFLQRNLF